MSTLLVASWIGIPAVLAISAGIVKIKSHMKY